MAVVFNLTHSVVLLQPQQQTQGRSGEVSDAGVKRIQTRCAPLSTRGNERIDGALQDSTLALRIAIRHVDEISTDWRLEFDGREYDISAVLPVSGARRRSWLIVESTTSNIISKEFVPQGERSVFGITVDFIPDPTSGAVVLDVSSVSSPTRLESPAAGTEVAFTIPTPTAGRRLAFIIPSFFPDPSAYYVGMDRSINQIGALVKVRARLTPGTIEGADDYVAWVTRHRKLTDTEVNDVLVWD